MSASARAETTTMQQDIDMTSALQTFNQTLDTLKGTLSSLNEQSLRLDGMSPTWDQTKSNVQELQRQVLDHKQDHAEKIENFKKKLQGMPQSVSDRFKKTLPSQVESRLVTLSQAEVAGQLHPITSGTLSQSIEDGEIQLRNVRVALDNSIARRKNASMSEGDAFAVVMMLPGRDKGGLEEDGSEVRGKKSSVYPADLVSIWAYDSETVKKLLTDYGLMVQMDHYDNLNAFLAYIGVPQKYHVVATQ